VLAHVRLGRMPYDEALDIQRRTHTLRVAGLVGDVLFTVEHDPVFTRGRSAGDGGFRVGLDDVARAGIAVRDVDRGGDVTYHGPGQMVAYPILDLRQHGRDVKAHVRWLEEAAIRTLARHGIAAGRRDGLPGVWTDRGKIASVGVSVRRWVSMHGLALNVAVDASHFAMINPCGLPVKAVSMNDILETPAALSDVEAEFVDAYARLLGARWQRRDLAETLEAAHE
jgi:lipoate-protein ligase B